MAAASSPPDLFVQSNYRDAPAAIAFLERAFGFSGAGTYEAGPGRIAHAELRFGRGYVMTASLRDDSPYRFVVPSDVAGARTGGVYVGTPDVDALYARAKAAGARILTDLHDTDYGSHDFSAVDPEGFTWSFGTYRPTAAGADPYARPEGDVYFGTRYADARAAIVWLAKAFGFEERVVYGDGPDVAHAELRFGSSLFMLGSGRADPKLKTPLELGGRYTHVLCGYVADPDAHCARARAAGAEILEEPADKPYGEGVRIYVARDLEGFVWSFGTYRPGGFAPASSR